MTEFNRPKPAYKTRPPVSDADPHRARKRQELLTETTAAAAAATYQPRAEQLAANARPPRTTAYVLLGLGALLAVLGLLVLISTGNVFIGILSGAVLVIGATAVIVGSALLSILGAL